MKTIGIDFDNTIVIYDKLFYKLALEKDLIPNDFPKNKIKIRNYLRSQNKDHEFTLLQSEVYGNRILDAEPAPNIYSSLNKIKDKYKLIIISHKTKYPYSGPSYDLHKAALNWLEKNNFISEKGLNFSIEDIFFKPSKQEKLKAINGSRCSYYIDDLPDILEFIDKKIKRILYSSSNSSFLSDSYDFVLNDWKDLSEIIK